MKKLQKLFLLIPLLALSKAHAMEKSDELSTKFTKENQERVKTVNGYNTTLKTYRKDGLLKFSEAIQSAKKLNDAYGAAKRQMSISAPVGSPQNKHTYIRLNFDANGQLSGHAVLLNQVVEAGRTISSVFRKDNGLELFNSETDGHTYLKIDSTDYEKIKKELEKIESLVQKSSNSFDKKTIIALSEEKEKMAQQISDLSKKLNGSEHSGKNGQSNGNGKQDRVASLHEQVGQLKGNLEKVSIERNKHLGRITELNTLLNKLDQQSNSMGREISYLSKLLIEGATEIDRLNKDISDKEACRLELSTRLSELEGTIAQLQADLKTEKNTLFNKKTFVSTFIGTAACIASYTGLKAAYNWYMNKA